MQILRGDVFLVDFNSSKAADSQIVGSEMLKQRPAVVLSENAINRVRRNVIVVPISTAPSPVEIFAVPVPSAGVLSVAVCDQVTAVNKATRLVRKLGILSTADLKAVEAGLKDALDLI